MELENIKQNTVWNDAAESINSNFAKIRQKIALIESGSGGSGSGAVDTAMSDTSENAVQNKVVKQYVDERAEQAYGQANEYTDEEIEHIEGVLNARIDSIVHVVYYYDGLSEEHKAENKKAYDAIMAGGDSCYVITDKTSSTKIIASAALKSSTIAGLMAYQIMPTSKDEITIGLLTLSLYEDGSTEQTTTLSYVFNREAVIALLSGKQNTLVSGTTIKTINGESILGEGDIVIESGGSDIVVDSSLDMNSENPIQNQAVAKQFFGLSEYLQEQYVSYSERFGIIQNQLPWISIVDFETAIEQEEPIGDDVRNALLEIGGYNPDNPYSTQGWVWSQGYLYTIKVIPTDAGVQIQLFSFKGWTEIAEDNSKVNHLPSQGGGSIEVDAELSESSENAVGNKAVTMALAETEEVAAAALNELNKRFEDYATKEDIDATLAEMDEEINHIEGVLEATIIEDEEVAAAALNDLDKRVTDLEQNGGGGNSGGGEGGGTSDITIDSALSTTSTNPVQNKTITTELNKKVDAVSGKGLSTNDYTTTDKNKLSGIASGAEVNVQSDWNATSGDAFIKNKPTFATINGQRIDQGGEIIIEGGSGGSNEGGEVSGDFVTRTEIVENESVIATALTDIDERLVEVDTNIAENNDAIRELNETLESSIIENENVLATTLIDLRDRIQNTDDNLTQSNNEKSELAATVEELISRVAENERVMATALTDLNERIQEMLNTIIS